ncbi:MAG: HigA family addiction module antidote protein [Candidatus Tectomicrobia bacterium]|nr:HigA family addiction module antidote protein [Candidatus Tectomicrobia bacterium]
MLPKHRPPTHPGDMLLKEFLEPLKITQTAFARHLGWSYSRLNEIIHGRRGITAASALALGEALGTGPEFWLNLQRDWDLWHSLRSHRPIPLLEKVASRNAHIT